MMELSPHAVSAVSCVPAQPGQTVLCVGAILPAHLQFGIKLYLQPNSGSRFRSSLEGVQGSGKGMVCIDFPSTKSFFWRVGGDLVVKIPALKKKKIIEIYLIHANFFSTAFQKNE